MRWGYILGPLILAPVLGLCFLLPRPGQSERLHFDSAALSLLICHTPSGAFAPFGRADSVSPSDPAAVKNNDSRVQGDR